MLSGFHIEFEQNAIIIFVLTSVFTSEREPEQYYLLSSSTSTEYWQYKKNPWELRECVEKITLMARGRRNELIWSIYEYETWSWHFEGIEEMKN